MCTILSSNLHLLIVHCAFLLLPLPIKLCGQVKYHFNSMPSAHLQDLTDLGRRLPLPHLIQEWQADIAQPGDVTLRQRNRAFGTYP